MISAHTHLTAYGLATRVVVDCPSCGHDVTLMGDRGSRRIPMHSIDGDECPASRTAVSDRSLAEVRS